MGYYATIKMNKRGPESIAQQAKAKPPPMVPVRAPVHVPLVQPLFEVPNYGLGKQWRLA